MINSFKLVIYDWITVMTFHFIISTILTAFLQSGSLEPKRHAIAIGALPIEPHGTSPTKGAEKQYLNLFQITVNP